MEAVTYGRVFPEIEARCPAEKRAKRKRTNVKIPSLGGRSASRFTDEQVTEAILSNLRGRRPDLVALDLGTSPVTVRHWCAGVGRAKCWFEAHRRWAAELGRPLDPKPEG